MNRREALSSVGIILGGTIIGSQMFLTGCSKTNETKSEEGLLTDQQIALLNEIGETILPKTERTPGAKEVNVGSFMNSIVSDFYTTDEQTVFLEGLKLLADADFNDMSVEERNQHLMQLEKEAGERLIAKKSDPLLKEHYYIMIKQLSIWGYLSSEAVAFNAFNHVVLTQKFIGCVPLKEGDKAIFREGGSGQAYNYATQHMRKA